MTTVLTNANRNEIIANGKAVVIDFWAVWCGPCRALAPVVEAVSEEYAGKVDFVKCNVDDCEDIAAEFNIRNIPTLVYIKDGVVKDRTVGVVPAETIKAKADSLLV